MTLNPHQLPVRTTADLTTMWQRVMEIQRSTGRSLWLAFHDDAGRVFSTITEIESLPLSPDAESVANLASLIETIVEGGPDLDGAFALLSRQGTHSASPFEEFWADALTLACEPYLRHPIMCHTPAGVRGVPLWTSAA